MLFDVKLVGHYWQTCLLKLFFVFMYVFEHCCIQPSVALVAPTVGLNSLPEQVVLEQVVALPPNEYVPGLQNWQLDVLWVSAAK